MSKDIRIISANEICEAAESAISAKEGLLVNWARELYIVSKSTLRAADHRRRCWICGDKYKVGDGQTVANTDEGNKLMHSRCYTAQARYIEPSRKRLVGQGADNE